MKKNSPGIFRYIIVAFLSAFITVFTMKFIDINYDFSKGKASNYTTENLQPAKLESFDAKLGDNSIIAARQKVAPSVVYIDTVSIVEDTPSIPFQFRDFFPPGFFGGNQKQLRGAGSGLIIKPNGYILTNEHVVRGAQKLRVTLYGGKVYDGRVVGADAQTDLAVVKIEAKNLPVVEFGDSSKLIPGQWVVAIGNPYGLQDSVTAGIISALNRSLDDPDTHNLIQTDAAINPGNSGGPLVDLSGKIVGINEAIIANAQGIGFAIPINFAKNIADQLIKKGKVERPASSWLGVNLIEIDERIADYYRVKPREGVLIQVFPDSPAAKSGLKDGDIIKEINRKKMTEPKKIVDLVKSLKVGQTIDILVLRKGRLKAFKIKLGARPSYLDGQEKSQNQPYSPFNR